MRFNINIFINKMIGRNSFLFFSILSFSQFIFAQTFERKIQWETTPKTITAIDGKVFRQPAFKNAVHSERFNLLPLYAERIPLHVTGEVSTQILNPVYSTLSGIDNESAAFISTELKVSSWLTVFKKQPRAYVEVLPFRKNSAGQIEKLESFTLVVSVTPKHEHRALNSFAANSVLASGNWYKLALSSDGIYKIDYNFIKTTLGIEPNSFNLNTLGVFGYSGGMVPDVNSVARYDDLPEIPTFLHDANGNNKLDDGDFLLFYGQAPDGWKFNSLTLNFSHEKNLFSDKSYYFLTTDAGTGKRIQAALPAGSPNYTVTDFDDRAFHESDEVNLLRSGRHWIGDKMSSFVPSKSFSFNFPNLITSSPVKINSVVAANTPYGSNTVVNVNGQTVITHYDSGIPNSTYQPAAVRYSANANYNSGGDGINITYTFNVSADPAGTASAYIDYCEILCRRNLLMSGDAMAFRNIPSAAAGNISQFILGNASSNIQVWDVTDVSNIQQMSATLNGSQLSFTASTDNVIKEFVAVNLWGSYGNPESVGKVANQNLHATPETSLLLITPDEFAAPAEELASYHASTDGITSVVLRLSQLYNEFASGKQDISAIRDFVRMLYERASDSSKAPQYLLLFGDGSYDPKGRIAESNNYIPTYQSKESYAPTASFTSDDFFGLLDLNEGGDIANNSMDLDIAIGRLPVESEQEAWNIVNKIKNYKRPVASANCVSPSTNNSWRSIVTFVADDLDNGGTTFENSSDNFSEGARTVYPSYNFEKIYLDAYKQVTTSAGDRYPDVNTAILNRINAGTLVLNWIGHGGETNWAHERVFNLQDIVPLANKEKLPLFITATCEFSRFDLPDRTAGEWLIVNGNGGGIGSLTTTRLVYSNANDALNSKALEYLFEPYKGRFPTMGEIMLEAKNNVLTDINNTRKFTLLGDPALTLNYPRYNIATTEVNNKPVSQPHDTLKALSEVTIKGEVRDDGGNKLTSFSGVVYPVVYDKINTLQTLGNDANSIISYKIYKNILFKGKASVTNGDFSFSFIVPKDIDYQFGNGRISYYADNGNYVDAHGYSNDIVIGGSADSFAADGNGPKMNIYMNDEKFVYGGITNASPMLLVNLQDESGINTSGNGIGHDLTAVLDNTSQNMTVLNDYYESELDNFRKGAIKYPFSKLSEGRHTLKVKAWDIHDNSSEDYTEFIVTSSAKLALSHVFNYPNPFTTRTEFMFEHNRCCDDLSVSIQIYSVAGKLVKTIQQDVYSDGYRVSDIIWDGLDDFGDPIGKGVYVYKVNVRDGDGNSAHKFEKLVVLR